MGLIKFRTTQMSDNQHKIKKVKITMTCLHTYSYRNTHYKTQLHNYEYSCLFINKKKLYLYLKFCRVLQWKRDFSSVGHTLTNLGTRQLTKWNHSNWCDCEFEMGRRLTCDISVSQSTVALLLATLKLLSVVKCVKC